MRQSNEGTYGTGKLQLTTPKSWIVRVKLTNELHFQVNRICVTLRPSHIRRNRKGEVEDSRSAFPTGALQAPGNRHSCRMKVQMKRRKRMKWHGGRLGMRYSHSHSWKSMVPSSGRERDRLHTTDSPPITERPRVVSAIRCPCHPSVDSVAFRGFGEQDCFLSQRKG